MPCDITTATDEILGRLKTQWDADARLMDRAVPSVEYTPQLVYEQVEKDLEPHPNTILNKAWARIAVRHTGSRAAALGNKRYRRRGYAWIQVYVPNIDSTALPEAQTLAKVVLNAYEGRNGKTQNVTFGAINPNERGADGSWWRFDMQVAFTWDEFK